MYSDEQFMKLFFKEYTDLPSLSKEEEKELLIQTKNGDINAKNTLIKGNLKLVCSFAKSYANENVSYLDLIQAGNEGLLEAIDKFDLSQDVAFGTYAGYFIKEKMLKYVTSTYNLIYTPSNIVQIANTARKFKNNYYATNNKNPSDDELKEELLSKYKETDVNLYLDNQNSVIYLDNYKQTDGILSENISDNSFENMSNEIETENLKNLLKTFISNLPELQQEVFCYSYGIEGKPLLSIKEITEKTGLNKNQILYMRNSLKKDFLEFLKANNFDI